MTLTLIGSARFENAFKEWNRRLSLAGHVVYSLAVYPSDAGGKDWYTPAQKQTLDAVHLAKIDASEGVVLMGDGYVGESTAAELARARNTGKLIFLTHPLQRVEGARMMCRFLGCYDPTIGGPCALCYE